MAIKAKRFLITKEEHEVFVIRNRWPMRNAHCSICLEKVEMLHIDAAVTSTGISMRQLFRAIESGQVHSIDTDLGHLLVCSRSLREYLQ